MDYDPDNMIAEMACPYCGTECETDQYDAGTESFSFYYDECGSDWTEPIIDD